MEEKGRPAVNKFVNTCSFAGVKPIMVDLPYPEIKVQRRNRDYADLLSVDYCGFVSELSAITQYINNENRICAERCSMARTLLGIAMAEMMHLQKLGELIHLLGGKVCFVSRQPGGRQWMWSPECLAIPENFDKMLLADIESERAAINQYQMHIKRIQDTYVNDVLCRIIKDEEYHIMMLRAMLNQIE